MIYLIFIILACGVLGYEIVNSDLSYIVKEMLWLDKYHPQIELLSKYNTYSKLLNKAVYLLFPLVALIITFFTMHQILYKMLQCQYCTSFWVGIIGGIVFGLTWKITLIVALLSMFGCAMYSKLVM